MKLNRVNSKSLCWLIFGGSVAPRGPGAEPIPPGRPAVRLSPQVDSLFWPVAMLDQGAGAAFASSQGLGLCAGPPTAPELRPSGSAPSGSRVARRLQMTCSGRLPRGCREKRGPPSQLTSCCEICTDAVERGNRLQAIVHGNPRHRRPLLPSADGRPGELEGADVVRPR